jgi:adenylate cyclase
MLSAILAGGRSKRVVLGLLMGLAAALLSLAPYVGLLEEKIGLGLMFSLRGEQTPSDDVVIIDIDRESARQLSAPENPELWPRRLHAELIERLHAAGAELVGFNIYFSAPHPEDDAQMADAMSNNRSVVLANYLKLTHLQGEAFVESLEEPPPQLAGSAVATAPFLLVEGEEAERFLTHFGENSDHPTFPLTLFRLFIVKKHGAELSDLLRHFSLERLLGPLPDAQSLSNSAAFFTDLENGVKQQPKLRAELLAALEEKPLPPAQKQTLLSLIDTLVGEKTRYFNHYGPAGAITRIPYHRLFAKPENATEINLHGKLVLVGFNENFKPGQSENLFYSPFSAVSSLELAATTIANLISHTDIQPLFGRWGQFLFLTVWGVLLGLVSSRNLTRGLTAILLMSAGYLAVAYGLFTTQNLWMPLILPIIFLLPLGMLACLMDNYLTRTREHRAIHSVISRFIPEAATRQLDQTDEPDQWEGKVSFGVCLATDAGQYTALAEKMNPMDLAELMNDYYATLFPAVRRHGGWVSDVTGDAMMAIWSVPTLNTDIRIGPLRAALEILVAVEAFQSRHNTTLPIRMGLNCGEMRVGFVGGKEHGAYRAVGDTVNTSARLEGLNKLLGTRILVSEPLVENLPGFITRPAGSFLLAGKSQPIAVHELIAPADEVTAERLDMIERFADALALFQAARWKNSAAAFETLAEEFPDDGPARFYAKTARANANNPLATAEWAAIQVSKPAPGSLTKR